MGYSPGVDDSENGDGLRGEPQERRITPNMLVAHNMTRWRRAADMTQEQLGERLGGWTKTAVSAAERSWDGKRVRQFDADLIASLARIFGVPVTAFFLPPADDGQAFRYMVETGNGPVSVAGFFVSAVAEFAVVGPESPGGTAYREALIAAVARYTDPGTVARAASSLLGVAGDEARAAALQRARESGASLTRMEDAIQDLRADNKLLLDSLLNMMRETSGGRAFLADMDRDEMRRGWDQVFRSRPDRRMEQEKFRTLVRELYGDRPMTEEETHQLIPEGRGRGIHGTPWLRKRLLDGQWELIAEVPPEGRGS